MRVSASSERTYAASVHQEASPYMPAVVLTSLYGNCFSVSVRTLFFVCECVACEGERRCVFERRCVDLVCVRCSHGGLLRAVDLHRPFANAGLTHTHLARAQHAYMFRMSHTQSILLFIFCMNTFILCAHVHSCVYVCTLLIDPTVTPSSHHTC